MIRWREGKAGFVGAAKRLLKGVFSYSYTETSAVPVYPDIGGAGISAINPNGLSDESLITAVGFAGESTITASFAGLSIIDDNGFVGTSVVTDIGIAGESGIKDGL